MTVSLFSDVFRLVRRTRIIVAVLLILAVLLFDLAIEGTTHETVLAMLMDRPFQLVCTFVSVTAASFVIRTIAEQSVALSGAAFNDRRHLLGTKWYTRLCGFAPGALAGVAVGFVTLTTKSSLSGSELAMGLGTSLLLVGSSAAIAISSAGFSGQASGPPLSTLLFCISAAPLAAGLSTLAGYLFLEIAGYQSFYAIPFWLTDFSLSGGYSRSAILLHGCLGGLLLLLLTICLGFYLRFASMAILVSGALRQRFASARSRYAVFALGLAAIGSVTFLPLLMFMVVPLFGELPNPYQERNDVLFAPITLDAADYIYVGATFLAMLAAAVASCLWVAKSHSLGLRTGRACHLARRWRRLAKAVGKLPRSQQRLDLLFLLLLLALLVVFSSDLSIGVAQLVGSMSVVFLWATAAVVMFSPLAVASYYMRVPLLLVIFCLSVGFSFLSMNDNHQVRREVLSTPLPEPWYFKRTISFADWLAARRDLGRYERYPVFAIGTEGGGLRAAYFTAMTLATLQDLCPMFAEHTVAVSGVSGGSIGTAVFAGLLASVDAPKKVDAPCAESLDQAPRIYRDATRRVFSQDFLSPLLAALMFPDALQRMLPYAVDPFDRARFIEGAFDVALDQGACAHGCVRKPGGMLFGELYSSNRPLKPSDQQIPWLFLNATDVSNGVVRAISPGVMRLRQFKAEPLHGEGFELEARSIHFDSTFWPLQFVRRLYDPADLPLSTAAFLSARFPLLMPAGVVRGNSDFNSIGGHGQAKRFVDGGYFENSGAYTLGLVLGSILTERFYAASSPGSTPSVYTSSDASTSEMEADPPRAVLDRMAATELIALLIQSTPCRNIAFGTVVHEEEGTFEDIPFCADGSPESRDEEGVGLGEVLSPIRTLLQVGNTQALRSISQLADDTIEQRKSYLKLCGLRLLDRDPFCSTGAADAGRYRDFYPFSTIGLSFFNSSEFDIPLTWQLSSRSLNAYDEAFSNALDTVFGKKVSASSSFHVAGDLKRAYCALARLQAPPCMQK
ncbi:patatin-like phospholipase family protein [Mesorhizobium escarrei]|uniref:PNPLA domain-containing protein n=1 Tax=Mesorhizobium escarrei TaxID=666018 RepID=A0ABN8KCL3_9HYPH|nr:patatin-like phospholipase family protein [Mesorhizobium escarrei]CAH2407284.1 membrane hypothetical protein [Mesorhizobium escarrei]